MENRSLGSEVSGSMICVPSREAATFNGRGLFALSRAKSMAKLWVTYSSRTCDSNLGKVVKVAKTGIQHGLDHS